MPKLKLLLSMFSVLATVAATTGAKADPPTTAQPEPTDSADSSKNHDPASRPDARSLPTSVRLVALRERLRDLDARTKAMRTQIERTKSRARQDSERIISTVEQRRTAMAMRVDILQVTGMVEEPNEGIVRQIEVAYQEADKLLTLVESWHSSRRAA